LAAKSADGEKVVIDPEQCCRRRWAAPRGEVRSRAKRTRWRPTTAGIRLSSVMQPLRAKVHNGRLVLDEPTDLPEGEVVELVPVDEVLASGGDYLDDEDRKRLHESIEESIEQMKAGNLIDADEALAELRAHR
jgi:hypothetical protein